MRVDCGFLVRPSTEEQEPGEICDAGYGAGINDTGDAEESCAEDVKKNPQERCGNFGRD